MYSVSRNDTILCCSRDLLNGFLCFCFLLKNIDSFVIARHTVITIIFWQKSAFHLNLEENNSDDKKTTGTLCIRNTHYWTHLNIMLYGRVL